MKHLIETTDLNSLPIVEYDRIVLDSITNDVIVKGGGYEYVDLGLPSRLKWAKCNVGAEKETDYGYYFQWGETTPDTNCTWESYKYCNGDYNTLTKYNNDSRYGTVDNKTVLDPEDDTATQIMGSDWRIPTQDECQELIDNTTKEWTQVNGVNGYKFTSKTDESKYIFIPAAGEGHDGLVNGVGKYCTVWISSLNTSHPDNAWCFRSSSSSVDAEAYDGRSYGFPVRGVRK